MSVNQVFLKRILTANLIGDNFLTPTNKYDVIIANPPFAKNQDIEHIYKMFDCLNQDGRIVTIASTRWIHSSNKKETAFRNWLEEIGAVWKPIEAGSFKDSGAMVPTALIIIDK